MIPSLVALAAFFGPADVTERPAYLFKMSEPAPERGVRYRPQPGDLVLFDDHSSVMANIYRTFGSAGPLHAAIVVPRANGKLGVLEAGTNGVLKVFIFDLDERFRNFDGTIIVRQPRRALSEEQKRRLGEFAAAQEGKSYAVGRVILQAATFRVRTMLGAEPFGRTVLDRDRWYCSELAAAATVAAGILDGDQYPANTMSPRDLCYDERYDLSEFYETPAMWYPRPELEHVGKGVRVITPKVK
jgi:hypothetical protein